MQLPAMDLHNSSSKLSIGILAAHSLYSLLGSRHKAYLSGLEGLGLSKCLEVSITVAAFHLHISKSSIAISTKTYRNTCLLAHCDSNVVHCPSIFCVRNLKSPCRSIEILAGLILFSSVMPVQFSNCGRRS